MRKLFLIAAAVLLGFGVPAADLSGSPWKLVLGPEFPGAKGSLTRNAAGELVLDSDFSGGGNYTGLALALKPPLDLAALEFEVLTRARSVGVQVVDSAGQTFVTFHRLAGNPALAQKVRVGEFHTPGRNGSAKWGGRTTASCGRRSGRSCCASSEPAIRRRGRNRRFSATSRRKNASPAASL